MLEEKNEDAIYVEFYRSGEGVCVHIIVDVNGNTHERQHCEEEEKD